MNEEKLVQQPRPQIWNNRCPSSYRWAIALTLAMLLPSAQNSAKAQESGSRSRPCGYRQCKKPFQGFPGRL